MEKELIYKFFIHVYSDSGSLIKTVDCGHFEFPSEDEIKDAIESNGGDYAEVHRVYTLDVIPFS